ncbi:MAG: hypothetical protein ACOYLH_11485 [Flavobacteriales bacterium]
MDNSNLYRKQIVRRELDSPKIIEDLLLEVETLSEQNKKLREELEVREELMQSLFSYIEANTTKKD